MHLKESEASGKISGLEKKIQYAEIEKVVIFLVRVLITFFFFIQINWSQSSGLFKLVLKIYLLSIIPFM